MNIYSFRLNVNLREEAEVIASHGCPILSHEAPHPDGPGRGGPVEQNRHVQCSTPNLGKNSLMHIVNEMVYHVGIPAGDRRQNEQSTGTGETHGTRVVKHRSTEKT
jgi:hypothetical protein